MRPTARAATWQRARWMRRFFMRTAHPGTPAAKRPRRPGRRSGDRASAASNVSPASAPRACAAKAAAVEPAWPATFPGARGPAGRYQRGKILSRIAIRIPPGAARATARATALDNAVGSWRGPNAHLAPAWVPPRSRPACATGRGAVWLAPPGPVRWGCASELPAAARAPMPRNARRVFSARTASVRSNGPWGRPAPPTVNAPRVSARMGCAAAAAAPPSASGATCRVRWAHAWPRRADRIRGANARPRRPRPAAARAAAMGRVPAHSFLRAPCVEGPPAARRPKPRLPPATV